MKIVQLTKRRNWVSIKFFFRIIKVKQNSDYINLVNNPNGFSPCVVSNVRLKIGILV